MRSEINDTKRPPPPLAAAHGDERENRPGERDREERDKRERESAARRERRESRRLGFSCLREFLQSFALEFLMRDKGGGGLYL